MGACRALFNTGDEKVFGNAENGTNEEGGGLFSLKPGLGG